MGNVTKGKLNGQPSNELAKKLSNAATKVILTPEAKAAQATANAKKTATRIAAETILKDDESTTNRAGWRLAFKPGFVLLLSVYPGLQIKLRGLVRGDRETENGKIKTVTTDRGKIAQFAKHQYQLRPDDLETIVRAAGYGNDFIVAAELCAALRGREPEGKGFTHVMTRKQAKGFVHQLCRRADLGKIKLDPIDVISELLELDEDPKLVTDVLEMKASDVARAQDERAVMIGQG